MNEVDIKNYSKKLKALSSDITDEMVKFTMTPEFGVFMKLNNEVFSHFICIDFDDKEYELAFNSKDSEMDSCSYIRDVGVLNKFNNFVSLKKYGFVMLSNCDIKNNDKLYCNDTYNISYCDFIEIYNELPHDNVKFLKKFIHNLSNLLNDFSFEKLNKINNQFIEISKIINIKNYNLKFYTNEKYDFVFNKNSWKIIDGEMEEELYHVSIKNNKIKLSSSKKFVSFDNFNKIINFA